jgi:oligopeptide transport system permease protein
VSSRAPNLCFSYNTSEYHKKMAIFAASEWKSKLGLNIETESMEFKVLLKKRHDGDFQMARNGWLTDYNDATSFLALVRCDSDQNNNFNCNREAEDLINQGTQSNDPAKRKALLTQASKMIMDDYPIIPLVQYSLPRLVKSYVGGYSNCRMRKTGSAARTCLHHQALGAVRPMWSFTIRRVLATLPTLLAVISVCYFCCMQPRAGLLTRSARFPPRCLPICRPSTTWTCRLWQQYLLYLQGLLQGDLGASFRYADWSVNDLVAKALPVSLAIGGTRHVAVHADWCDGLGIVAALRQNSVVDHTVMLLGNIGSAFPSFVIGPVLIMVFAISLGWLPAGGWNDFESVHGAAVALLTIINVSTIGRVMRGSLIEVMHSNFIRTARAKGLPERIVVVAPCPQAGPACRWCRCWAPWPSARSPLHW